jgi:hypothetical protein
MYALISSRKGAFVGALATAALAAILGVQPVSATTTVTNLVANGDFTANAADFQTFPGYTGGSGNATAITDWTTVAGYAASTDNTGINLLSNGGNGSPAAFQPQNFVFAFMQGAGTGLFQQISGLTVGQAYSVSYLAASRYDPSSTITSADLTAQALTASVTNGSQTDGSLVSNGTNTAPGTVMVPNFFELQLFGFTASATSEMLSFTNSSPATFDSAVDISGVVIDPINSAAVPEPASWMLLAASVGGLLVLRPRRLRRH